MTTKGTRTQRTDRIRHGHTSITRMRDRQVTTILTSLRNHIQYHQHRRSITFLRDFIMILFSRNASFRDPRVVNVMVTQTRSMNPRRSATFSFITGTFDANLSMRISSVLTISTRAGASTIMANRIKTNFNQHSSVMNDSAMFRIQRTSQCSFNARFLVHFSDIFRDLTTIDVRTFTRGFFKSTSFRTLSIVSRDLFMIFFNLKGKHQILNIVANGNVRSSNTIFSIVHRNASLIRKQDRNSRTMAKGRAVYQFRTSSATMKDQLASKSTYVQTRNPSHFAQDSDDHQATKEATKSTVRIPQVIDRLRDQIFHQTTRNGFIRINLTRTSMVDYRRFVSSHHVMQQFRVFRRLQDAHDLLTFSTSIVLGNAKSANGIASHFTDYSFDVSDNDHFRNVFTIVQRRYLCFQFCYVFVYGGDLNRFSDQCITISRFFVRFVSYWRACTSLLVLSSFQGFRVTVDLFQHVLGHFFVNRQQLKGIITRSIKRECNVNHQFSVNRVSLTRRVRMQWGIIRLFPSHFRLIFLSFRTKRRYSLLCFFNASFRASAPYECF